MTDDLAAFIAARKEVCEAGHAIEGDNLRVVGTLRRCRICDNERSRKWQWDARRTRGVRQARLTEDEEAAILALRRDGMSHRKIAKSVGRSLMAVQRVVREAAL